MTRLFIAVIIVAATIAVLSGCSNKKIGNSKVAELPHKEIRDLSYAIKNIDIYRRQMREQLALMKDSLESAGTDEDKCSIALALSAKFRANNTDSAICYAYKARMFAEYLDADYLTRADIAVVNSLSTAGLFTEATDLFESIDETELGPDTRLEYWIAARRLYAYMKSYVQEDQEWYLRYNDLYQQYDDSLLMYLPANSEFKAFLQCERMVTEKRYHEAQHFLELLMDSLPLENNLYGMSAFQMAEVWRNLGDDTRYAAFLAKSALSDVEGCVAEGLALPTLADWLYRRGEFDNAFMFINFALEEASESKARMRAVSIAQFVPLIDGAYKEKIDASRNEFLIYFILVTVLLLSTAFLILFLARQMRKTKANTEKLAQTSKRQESYIGNFIGLYSSYAERFNYLTRLVSTKLAAGQGAELKKLIDSGKFSDQENSDVHKIFDSAFLDIYPDFVEQINSLLRPEEAITVKTSGSLTPELRIYAFVRLGVEESTRIAQILHYSINTVYTYRNKMRNKAISRDTFDSDVKNLTDRIIRI